MGKSVWTEEDEENFRSGVREFFSIHCNLNIDLCPQPELFYTAFTSITFFKGKKAEVDQYNERLEFFGDSVSKIFTRKYLYKEYPEFDDWQLSPIGGILDANDYLVIFLEDSGIDLFSLMKADKSMENKAPAIADCFEAILGALDINGKRSKAQSLCRKVFVTGKSKLYRYFHDGKYLTMERKLYTDELQGYCKNVRRFWL